MNGVLVLDKPEGFTSFDAVALMRRLCGERKAGHTGTLDPMATGVLPILLGSGTKAIPFLEDTEKEYEAAFSFGVKMDTGDRTGTPVAHSEKKVTREELEKAMPAFRGDILQIPPMYSAVSVNGQRLYQLARKGVEVERAPRPVRVEELELLTFSEEEQTGRLRMRCSKGTYVRVLIEDLAAACSSVGHMTALRRVAACGFTLEQAVTVETMRTRAEEGTVQQIIRPVESLFEGLCAVKVSPAQSVRFQNGGALFTTRVPGCPKEDASRCRVYGPDQRFLGLGIVQAKEGILAVLRLFPGE